MIYYRSDYMLSGSIVKHGLTKGPVFGSKQYTRTTGAAVLSVIIISIVSSYLKIGCLDSRHLSLPTHLRVSSEKVGT